MILRRTRLTHRLLGFVVLPLALAESAVAQIEYRVAARPGWPAQGLADGVTYGAIDIFPISRTGHVMYKAKLSGPGIDSYNNEGVWVVSGDDPPKLVAAAGEIAPSFTSSEQRFRHFSKLAVNDAGEVAFAAVLHNGLVSTSSGIWAKRSGTDLRLIVGHTQPHTGIPGVGLGGYGTLDYPLLIGEDGSIVFTAELFGDGITFENRDSIWVHREEDGLVLVAQNNTHAPEYPGTVVFNRIEEPSIRPNGFVTFWSELDGTGVNRRTRRVVWEQSVAHDPVATEFRGGVQAADAPAGQNYFEFESTPSINSSGHNAFTTTLTGAGVTAGNDAGVWVENDSGTRLVARKGNLAPGAPAGVVFDSFDSSIAFNDNSEAAFLATLTGPGVNDSNDSGIWVVRAGNEPELVALEGERAVGTPDNTYFGPLSPPQINNAGVVVVESYFERPNVNPPTGHGLWATGWDGQLRLVAATGQQFTADVGDGEVDDFILHFFDITDYSSSQTGKPGCIDDNGTIVLHGQLSQTLNSVLMIRIPQGCPADVNGDLLLTPTDFTAWLGAYNNQSERCDQNGDGACLPNDFSSWISNFNTGCGW